MIRAHIHAIIFERYLVPHLSDRLQFVSDVVSPAASNQDAKRQKPSDNLLIKSAAPTISFVEDRVCQIIRCVLFACIWKLIIIQITAIRQNIRQVYRNIANTRICSWYRREQIY